MGDGHGTLPELILNTGIRLGQRVRWLQSLHRDLAFVIHGTSARPIVAWERASITRGILPCKFNALPDLTRQRPFSNRCSSVFYRVI